jgi:hypothetical protein
MLVLGAGLVNGQSDRGTIRGTVVDPNGAVIANAKVTVTGLENGEVRDTVTGDEGIYVFPELKAGLYKVTVEAQGFSRTSVDNVKVDVQGIQTLQVKLQIGEVSGNVVTVQAESVAINSDTPVRQSTVTERQVRELPLAVASESGGRTPLSFIFLDSNVGASDNSGNNNASNFRVSGGQGAGVEILIDGASTRRTQNGNFFTEVAPGPNAYQEFTISTNSYSAEFGNSSGGIVNFTLKSGTNEFHGEVYDLVRNEVFNANSINNKARKLDRNRDNQNNYGFNIGGPIGLPGFGEGVKPYHLYKDRAFFFFNYEGYKFIRGLNTLTTVPTVRMRTGDFSEYLTAPEVLSVYPNGIQIFDPRQPSNARSAIPGNRLDLVTSLINGRPLLDPAGLAILSFYPVPNRPGVHDNYLSSSIIPNQSNQYTFKTDFVLTSRQRLTFSYSKKKNDRIAGGNPILPLPFTQAGDTCCAPWDQKFRSHIGRLQHDYTVTSNMLNHLNIGYTYFDVVNANSTLGFDTSSLGIPRNATPNLAFPYIDFVGISNNAGDPRYVQDIGGVDFSDHLKDGTAEISDFVSLVHGRHTFKFGASYKNAQYNVQQTLHPGGRFGFHEGQTSRDGVANSGAPLASLITGATEWSFFQNNSIDPAFRQISQSYFVQDDVKVTSKLTINVGLRYDLPGLRFEAGNRYRSFDPDVVNPAINRPGAIVGAGGQGGLAAPFRTIVRPDRSDIGPRFGAAYAINSKTVVRGGIGYYYSPILYGFRGAGAVRDGTIGYNNDYRNVPDYDNGGGNNTVLNHFLSNYVALAPVNPNDQFVGNTDIGIPYFDKNFRTGRTLQYTVDLQRELPLRLIASVGYIGHRADRLRSNFGRINALPLNALKLGFEILNRNVSNLTAADRTYATSVGITLPANSNAVYSGFNGTVARALSPFPQYGQNFQNFLESKGESEYNALQLKLDRRFGQGFQFGLSYTFSRLISNASEDVLGGGTAQSGVLQNPYDLKPLKTISPSNSPHVFVFNFLAELPFGKGKRYLDSGGAVNALFGGWQVAGIFRYQQGTPLIFELDADYGTGGHFLNLVGFNSNLRPNLTGTDINTVGPCNPNIQAVAGREYVLNCRAFSAPPDFARPNAAVGTPAYAAYYSDPNRFFGTAPVVNTSVRSDMYTSENLNILKKTRITERLMFEIGAEFFNLFNRARFLPPDVFLGRPNSDGSFQNSNFGAKGSLDPRSVQLRGRVIF